MENAPIRKVPDVDPQPPIVTGQSGHSSRAQAYVIRPARAVDLDRMVELLLGLQDHLEASNSEVWRMKPEARAQFRGQVTSRLKAADACALVAEHHSDGVVGVIFGRVAANKRYSPTRAGIVDQIFVDECHRRAGVGSRLVEELCRFFCDRGIHDLSLRYVAGNEEAASFWADLGFAPRITTVGALRQTVEERLAQTRCA